MIIINNSFVYMEASYLKKKKDEITIRSSTAEYSERLLERIREIRFFEAYCHYLPTAKMV